MRRNSSTKTAELLQRRDAPLTTPTDLTRSATKDISGAMNAILADVFALYLKTKNFHWHLSVRHFRDYNLLLDEHAEQLFAITDPIAERIRKIGGSNIKSHRHSFRPQRGHREDCVIAHDRRGHDRSHQTSDGHDMDHYADDLAALTAHLDLKHAVHVGHSTGGGEVAHYLGRHGESRVAKAALISAVPPLMVKTEKNPGGLPKEVFDGLQAQLAANLSP